MNKHSAKQQGYFLIIAVIFIVVIGFMGMVIAYQFSNRALLNAAESEGLRTFYIAESGLEIGARMLTMPNVNGTTPTRVACSSSSQPPALTNIALGSGQVTVTETPVAAQTTLSGALTAAASTIPVASTSGFATTGRVMIDREIIDYAGISGNSFILATRGASGSRAASHATTAPVAQYQCGLDAQAGIPSLAAPKFQRQLQWSVPLQDAWAVGDRSGNNFSFVNWNRVASLTWTDSSVSGSSATRGNLNAVSMLSYASGWAAGDIAGSNFNFFRWNGSSWTLTQVSGACSGQNLAGISMVSASEGWAVGARYRPSCASGGSNFRYTVMRWNGSAWSLVTPTTIPSDSNANQNLNAVSVIDATGSGAGTIGFAVGDAGRILRYNGATWVALTSPTTQNLYGVQTISASEAWAVGAAGTIIKWNGSNWVSVSSPTGTQLNSISMVDSNGDGLANNGWAVGNSGVVVSYNGSSWSAGSMGAATLLGVGAMNANDAWAVGSSGSIYHWDGSSWSLFSNVNNVAYNGISVISTGTKQTVGWQQVFR